MARFELTVRAARPAGDCFAHLTDWDAHSAAIPLTRLRHSGRPRVGQEFVARTGVGPLGFDDPMRVELLRPPAGDRVGDLPGVVEVTKRGRVVAGRVRWTVAPATRGSVVTWSQELLIPWLPGWLDPLVGLVGRAAYGAGLTRLAR